MIRSLRRAAVATAALVVASAASAATYNYEFKEFYDTSTLNPFDKSSLVQPIANLSISDISGGVQLKLRFENTAFPANGNGLSIDELWLKGPRGALASASGSPLDSDSGYYTFGFLAENGLYNWDIEFKAGDFDQGETSTLTIKGTGVTAKSFTGAMLEVTDVGGKYAGFLGLNKNVHFVGTTVPIPEPSTYALMGLGLVGVAFAARRNQRRG